MNKPATVVATAFLPSWVVTALERHSMALEKIFDLKTVKGILSRSDLVLVLKMNRNPEDFIGINAPFKDVERRWRNSDPEFLGTLLETEELYNSNGERLFAAAGVATGDDSSFGGQQPFYVAKSTSGTSSEHGIYVVIADGSFEKHSPELQQKLRRAVLSASYEFTGAAVVAKDPVFLQTLIAA